MNNEDIVYFSVNNWGSDLYPQGKTFHEWMKDDLNLQLSNEQWAIDNELCIVCEFIDMSDNFCVAAKRSWVEQHCPEVLGTKFEYKGKNGERPEEGMFGTPFPEYCKENFGVHFFYDPEDDVEEDDEENDVVLDKDGNPIYANMDLNGNKTY